MSLFRSIFKYVWPHIQKYKFLFYSIFILFGIRTVLDYVIRPIYFKKIIDTLSIQNVDRLSRSQDLLFFVFIMISINLILLLISRVGKFMIYDFEINVIKELRNFSFQRIIGNSQTFFANTFSGSLVTKSNRFVNSFEKMFDLIVYNFYASVISFTGMLIVIYKESKQISFLFLGFVVIYIAIIFIFIKKKMFLDETEAKSDSRISGRLADVFGNILAVKIFSAHKKEKNNFEDITKDGQNNSKKGLVFWWQN